jgi:hypothetical protein
MLNEASDPALEFKPNWQSEKPRSGLTLTSSEQTCGAGMLGLHIVPSTSFLKWEACLMSTPVNLALARYATKA